MLKEFTLLNGDCDLFSQAVLCVSQQQKKLGMQPCMNLGLSLETCATLKLVPRQSQVEFVCPRTNLWHKTASYSGKGQRVFTIIMYFIRACVEICAVFAFPLKPTAFRRKRLHRNGSSTFLVLIHSNG